jgi:hypothetical protein
LALASSSSRILLNRIPGRSIKHERGLRQGDPISPMLFILAMTPLQRILHMAVQKGVMSSISPRSRGIKASLYANDVAIFVKPQKQGIAALKEILEMFGQASGLRTNLLKSEVLPISCQDLDLDDIMDGFMTSVKSFPCRYLGLLLHLRRLCKIAYMPLLDKVGGKLTRWKGKLMSKAARAQLMKSVLTLIVTYHATVFPLPKWLIKKIDKLRHNFF